MHGRKLRHVGASCTSTRWAPISPRSRGAAAKRTSRPSSSSSVSARPAVCKAMDMVAESKAELKGWALPELTGAGY